MVASCDYLIILMGGAKSRPFHGARHFHTHGQPQIILIETEATQLSKLGYTEFEWSLYRKILLDQSVPAEKITVVPAAITSTFEEAQLFFQHLNQLNQSKRELQVTVITDWFHSSRATWIFRKFAPPNIQIFSDPAIPSDPSLIDQWWRNENSFLAVYTEYLKWLYYLLNY